MPLAHRLVAACALAGIVGISGTAGANATLVNGMGGVVDYGTQCLQPNDDGSGPAIDLTPAFPQGLHFFTAYHTTAYVNTNGNITFSGPLWTYTPNAFPVAAQPMIAPYWGDVDIRNTGGTCQTLAVCQNPTENGVWWHLEPGRMVVTWDRVGYFSCHNDLRMSFQLIITEAGCGGAGDFDVEFRFNQCEWETGDASGGSNGFGGTEAQAGFDAGNLVDFIAIPGSLAPGIANEMCNNSNVGDSGVWQFQIRSGSILCPDAGAPCDTGLLGVCAGGRTNCVGSGTECIQDVQAGPEECDGLDNDCDGLVDEDDQGPVCPSGMFCAAGTCVAPCTEFGCGEGEICDTNGVCVDELCVGVTCDVGLVCKDGVCVGPCDGVTCPFGLECRAGQCVDLCVDLTCDDCTICEDGVCVGKCEYTPCDPGETCQPDGHCVEDTCIGVTCNAGSHCEGGTCIDSCLGAVCPDGETCSEGQCVDSEPGLPDGGTEFPDGSFDDDAGTTPNPDGGGVGAGGPTDFAEDPASAPECGCYVVGFAPSLAGGLLWLAAAALATFRRRRRGSDGK